MVQSDNDRTASGDGPPLGAPREAALDWLARLQAPDVTAAEQAAFAAWRADPANAEAWTQVEALWRSEALTGALRRQVPATPAAATPGAGRRWAAAAAALAAVLLLAVGLGATAGLDVLLRSDYRTAAGERRQVTLADGSRLVLDGGSAVAVDFEGTRREVELLEGAVYVEVVPDPRRPFELRDEDAVARVLGTAFSMRSGPQGTRVDVRHGRVAVEGLAAPAAVAELGAGDAVTVREGRLDAGTTPDPDPFAWLEGRLVFRARPLGEVLAELDRQHRGWILVADESLAARQVSGNYRLDDPAAVAASLAAATGARLLRFSDYLLILR